MNIKKVSDEEIAKFYTNKPISIQEVCKKFNLCNVTISRALKRQNVHNRKIPFLKDKMMRHFIRGLFDGDGSFFRTNHWNLFLCGHEYFHDIYDFLVQRLDLNTVKITFEDNIYQCRWGDTKNVQDFANYIYTDAHIYLTRKYDKFKEFGFV